jgi:general secretion pathway protein D
MFDPIWSVPSSRTLRPSLMLDGGKEATVASRGTAKSCLSGLGTDHGTTDNNNGRSRTIRASLAGAFGLAALLALAAPGSAQTLPQVEAGRTLAPAPSEPPLEQAPGVFGRDPRAGNPGAHGALTSAAELQRRGEYEQAAERLREAEAQKDRLTPIERQELARWQQTNRASLETRRQAVALLAQAEKALRDRQLSQGRDLVRRLVPVEQALTTADRQRLEQMRRSLGVASAPRAQARSASDGTTVGTGSVKAELRARQKVQEARGRLAVGDFDGAERLAREASQLSAEFSPSEDRPIKVLEDISRSRRDPKTLLAAARKALEAGNLDRADELALAADKAKSYFTFPLWGDTPGKVRRDILAARSRGGPASESSAPARREATARGPVDKAPLPHEPSAAEKKKGSMIESVRGLFGSKTRQEPKTPIEESPTVAQKPPAAGTRPPKASTPLLSAHPGSTQAPSEDSRGGRPTAVAGNTEAARQLIDQGRKALKDGRLDLAQRYADQAREKKPDLAAWEYSPARLERDIQQALAVRDAARSGVSPVANRVPTPDTRNRVAGGGSRVAGEEKIDSDSSSSPATRHPPPATHKHTTRKTVAPRSWNPPQTQEEADKLIREGRKLLATGELDDAASAAATARTFKGRYGLFEDSPDRLLNDIKKAREAQDRKEATRLLAEGRRLLAAGDLDQAQSLAYRAQQLHGPYYLWDLSDRPSKLLAAIEEARSRQPAQANHTSPKRQREGGSGGTRSEQARSASERAGAGSPSARSTVREGAPVQARQLMAEAQTAQKQGKLIEAREKAVLAQKLHVVFGPDELSPERFLLQLAGQARQQSDRMVQQATNVVSYGRGTQRQNCDWAEKQLQAARVLTVGFGLDPRPIDSKLTWVDHLRSSANAGTRSTGSADGRLATPATPATPVAGRGAGGPAGVARASDRGAWQVAGGERRKESEPFCPATHPPPPTTQGGASDSLRAAPRGLELLELSRLELRKGQTVVARKLAEEAYTGNFGVKDLALRRLREVDIEENNQRRLEGCRSFDAGLAAFNRGDFFQAKAILTALKSSYLDPVRQARLREVMATPQMGSQTRLVQNTEPASPVRPATPGRLDTGSSRASDLPRPEAAGGGASGPLAEFKARQKVLEDDLRLQSIRARNEAGERARAGDLNGAVEILEDFLTRLPESELDRQGLKRIRRPIESLKQKYGVLRAQAEVDAQVAGAKKKAKTKVTQATLVAQNRQKKVAERMERFNKAYKEARYKEAYQEALIAKELDPNDPLVTSAMLMARTMIRRDEYQAIKDQKENMVLKVLNEADTEGPPATLNQPMIFDLERNKIANKRKALGSIEITPHKSKAAQEIESKLNLPVNLSFNQAPLRQVLDELRVQRGINIHPDYDALLQEGVSLNDPITAQLENISLKSALNLLLKQAKLTWVVRDEVLLITTPANAKGKLVQRHYQVADLVTPIENYNIPSVMNFDNQLQNVQNRQSGIQQSQGAAAPGAGGLPGGQPAGVPGGSSGAPSPGGRNAPYGPGAQTNSPRALTSSSMHQQLINLITSTVDPNSWAAQGGPGTIDYFPLGMTLVINQTLDIQEQIADLLAALRRLQDQEVAIEVRLITIADAFFERLGLDLDFKIKTDSQTARYEPQLTTGAFKPAPYINDFSPNRLIAGLTPGGTFTSDLDIPIDPTSFARAIPPFGGFPNMPGANGGISLGLAFLSDIQVLLFMEAAQGDQRTNVMQAPRLTMFNGQTASLTVNTSQYFVLSVSAIQNGGQITFLPQNTPIPLGVNLTLQPVITGDRRFVRVNAGFSLTNLASAIVPLFPVVTSIQPFFEGIGNVGNPVLFTQYIQQPVFTTVGVQTTVVVPDGGTVLLGGLKRLSEGRNEFGPPVLSKIPYISRLFKNVGYGRETESILLMITPRIIINEEEEILQTGVISNPTLVQ